MRCLPFVAMAVALGAPAAVYAQQITVSGWVDRVDATNSTITLRTMAGPRTVQVAPNAVVRVNNQISRLDRLPANSQVSIVADKDSNGVLRATQLTAMIGTAQPSAAAPPGAIVRGTITGINVPNNTLTVRTVSGDFTVPMGTAPIIMNGVRASTRALQIGQQVQVERALPTAASTDFVTQTVRILPTTHVATGRPAVRTRTMGARSSYSAKKSPRAKKKGKHEEEQEEPEAVYAARQRALTHGAPGAHYLEGRDVRA